MITGRGDDQMVGEADAPELESGSQTVSIVHIFQRGIGGAPRMIMGDYYPVNTIFLAMGNDPLDLWQAHIAVRGVSAHDLTDQVVLPVQEQ